MPGTIPNSKLTEPLIYPELVESPSFPGGCHARGTERVMLKPGWGVETQNTSVIKEEKDGN